MFTLTSDSGERNESELSIKGVRGDILQQLIEYCYSGEISIDSASVGDVMKAASMLQFTEVQEHCTEFYSTVLSVLNCLDIWEFADVHNVRPLKALAKRVALENFAAVSMLEAFNRLGVEELTSLLKEDEANVTSEEEVLRALLRWIKYDVDNRKEFLGTLLPFIRYEFLKGSVS